MGYLTKTSMPDEKLGVFDLFHPKAGGMCRFYINAVYVQQYVEGRQNSGALKQQLTRILGLGSRNRLHAARRLYDEARSIATGGALAVADSLNDQGERLRATETAISGLVDEAELRGAQVNAQATELQQATLALQQVKGEVQGLRDAMDEHRARVPAIAAAVCAEFSVRTGEEFDKDGELACALTGCVGTAVVVTRCCQKRLCQECKEGVRRARCPFCRATPLESDRITVGQSTRLREMAEKDVLESATAAGKRSLTQPIPAPPPAKRTHPTAQQIPHLQPSPTSTSRVDEATSSQRFPSPTYSLDSPVQTDGDGEAIRSGSSGALTGGANGAESGADSAVPAEVDFWHRDGAAWQSLREAGFTDNLIARAVDTCGRRDNLCATEGAVVQFIFDHADEM
jgi:cell division septation protein DedD